MRPRTRKYLLLSVFPQSTPCKHPVIVLQDVAFSDLHSLVEFIYHGEVNVHQRNLSSFLKTAEVLRVSGLTQQVDDKDDVSCLGDRMFQRLFFTRLGPTVYLDFTFQFLFLFFMFLYFLFLYFIYFFVFNI